MATIDPWFAWVLIVGMALIVFFTRAIFVLPGSKLRLPPLAERILRYAPAAALTAIIVPDLALHQGTLALSADNPRLLAGFVAFGIAAATRNIMFTIIGGMLVFTLLRLAM